MDIKTLAAMDDESLRKALRLDKKLDEAKEGIAEMNKLEGKAREEAEERVKNMFEPHIYADEFKWIAKDAKRAAKTGKEEAADCCCESVI